MNINKTLVHITGADIEKLRQHAYQETKEIPYLSEPISYEEFFNSYLVPNKPCLLGTWATSAWRASTEWVNSYSQPNLEFIRDKFGDIVGPVADCNREEYSSHPKTDMCVQKYVEYLQQYAESGYNKERPCYYLKDWHFNRDCPDYDAYQTPEYFSSDWLNEFWDIASSEDRDDYRFVYIGPKGSWTPFHADVFRSYSWSANVVGKKRWLLFPPGEEDLLKDRFGQLVYDLRSPELDDRKKFPQDGHSARRFEVTQKSGEVLFVPSGWHHQVFNEEDTISVNHNWLNGCNVDLCWAFLKQNLSDVQNEISDCRDMDGWHNQCQLILKASSGINYTEFYKFMLTIGKRRMDLIASLGGSNMKKTEQTIVPKGVPSAQFYTNSSELQTEASTRTPYYENLTLNHALFDLSRISAIVSDMSENIEFKEIDPSHFELEPDKLLETIKKYLKDTQADGIPPTSLS